MSKVLSYVAHGGGTKIGNGPICGHDDKTESYLSSSEPNWSSVNVDAPYCWCWVCSGVCTCSVEGNDGSADGDIDES